MKFYLFGIQLRQKLLQCNVFNDTMTYLNVKKTTECKFKPICTLE